MADRIREHIIDVLTNSDDPKRISEAIWDIIVHKLDHKSIMAELPPDRSKRAMEQAMPLLQRYYNDDEL
ncbi:hypothetical protein [Methylobacterium sp. yr668]|uniref:hypothetical protein n=1 Tax=Methylobacterium sp. yr668 TaxID=1761801 RepID=UPI0008F0113A|nr:hypothetical protein [Methylobacterium sp. yr668]SFT26954.1 hypothetical protein SAMN04487845_13717 [Methylobacterium sp. yr668]